MRAGIGLDFHCLARGRKLIRGGIEIPFERGLVGHSDADVLIHAIIDAILGAAAMGDIGEMFPDKDKRYRGADSTDLLKTAYEAVKKNGFVVSNVDSTVICEKPTLAPYKKKMTARIAEVLSVPTGVVCVKATSNEGMGPTGRGEGIEARAVALLKKQ